METELITFLPRYLVCIDRYCEYNIEGRLFWNSKIHETFMFKDIIQLIIKIDDIISSIQCPCAGSEPRTFLKEEKETVEIKQKKEAVKSMRELDTYSEVGEKATFILQIKYRQNSSWQGTVKWVEKKKEINFRSALELIKIIDSACEQGYKTELVENQA